MAAGAGGLRLRLRPTLRVQLAFVIALLSLVPNLVMAGLVLLPTVRASGGLEPAALLTLVGWLVAVVALSGTIGWLLARVLLSPLTSVTRDADALPRTAPRLGRARLPLSEDDPPEVASLRVALNRLLAQVQTEQQRRNAFTATLMHDMKTPLLAQGNALRLMRDDLDALAAEDRRALIDGALGETESLLALVQQLVDAHRFERGEVRAQRTRTRLRALVGAEAARLEPVARERGIAVEITGEAEVNADPDLLARAFQNLLSNAVRYAGSRVTVEIRRGMVRIADDGPGLPAPLEALAQPFNEQPAVIAGRRYGVGAGGLGLYIARSILEAHGGRLVLETRGPGGTVLLAYLGEGT